MIKALRVLKVCRKTAVAARRIALQMIQMNIVSAPDEHEHEICYRHREHHAGPQRQLGNNIILDFSTDINLENRTLKVCYRKKL